MGFINRREDAARTWPVFWPGVRKNNVLAMAAAALCHSDLNGGFGDEALIGIILA